MLQMVKNTFLFQNASVLKPHNPKGFEVLAKARSFSSFFRLYARHFSGYDSYESYLAFNNPIVNVAFVTKPVLALNSYDDPVCSSANIEDFRALHCGNHFAPSTIHVETHYGSHCIFYDCFARNWGLLTVNTNNKHFFKKSKTFSFSFFKYQKRRKRMSDGLKFFEFDAQAIKQQQLKAVQPILTPVFIVVSLVLTGIVFIVIGSLVLDASKQVVEYTTRYDNITECKVLSSYNSTQLPK
ncbi:hypothetical protein RFI_20297, partial [Reticulomyxa filosa]